MVAPVFRDGKVALYLGDCVEVLASMESASVDAVVTDPPYGLEFMGKEWDRLDGARIRQPSPRDRAPGSAHNATTSLVVRNMPDAYVAGPRMQEWHRCWAAECLRVLKPGGHLLAFGGTRTYHRLACGLEDAGFEIRDCLAWLYGSGFPKSRNLDGDWQGWGTALKPAHEPIVLARKPLAGTVAANVLEHGAGALNIDGCRIATQDDLGGGGESRAGLVTKTEAQREAHAARVRSNVARAETLGRWPANVILDEQAAALLDEQTGVQRDGVAVGGLHSASGSNAIYARMERVEGAGDHGYGGSGGASRFFYCAKTSRVERNAGLDGFPAVKSADDGYGPHKTQNNHPTVKPIALMRWLVRLVTPPDGLVLDPFLGSGTTGIAAALEGFEFIGIEREPDYLKIAEARIAYWRKHGGKRIGR